MALSAKFARPGIAGRPAACAAALCALALAGSLAGCGESAERMRGARSVFTLFQPPSPADAVELALDEYDPDNRYEGTALLANASFAGDEAYLQLFRDAARDEDAGVRQVGVRALGIHGMPEDVPLVVERLEDREWLVRMAAARSLQRLHNPVAVVPLMDRVKEETEPEAAVRTEAARALGQYRDARVLQALIGALNDTSLAVNHNAIESLEVLTGQNLGYEPAAWLAWLETADDPFAAGRVYTYPGFRRDKIWFEYLPFMPSPPREADSLPVGLVPTIDGAEG